MKFPNAAKGVKKIFNAEIISLIAALIGGAGLILGLIGASKETGESAGTIMLAVSGALGAIFGTFVCERIDPSILRKIFGTMLVITGIFTLKKRRDVKTNKNNELGQK